MTTRIFTASFISPKTINYTNKKELLQKHLDKFPNSKTRFMKDDYLHLTWSFLGEIDSNLIPEIQKITKDSIEDTKQKYKIDKLIFSFEFSHIGLINLYKNQGVYALMGKAKNQESLEFHKILNTKFSKLLEREMNMNYKPHITLARTKFSSHKDDINVKIPVESFTLNFDSIELVQSTLSPTGSIYKKLDYTSIL